ncbi:DUF1120 domain-containing protein [Pseudomonas sp. Ant30-3]|uniref:DUF1120 domain-containing protein n=1 Tax=Pseudomonas sp. Ant30-3 TaxID=1488328 RepID=UPI0004921BB8|nr:DUF1120 domain-containing protein [Pseudomonas sp. Ant30-3]
MNLSRYLLLPLIPFALGGFTPLAMAAADDCQLSVNQSVLDFGLMNRAIQPESAAERLLGERPVNLTLSCSQAVDMSVFYRAMASTAERFHFAERGSYRIRIRDAQLDGRSVDVGLIAGVGQAPVESAASLIWRPHHAVIPVQAGVPTQGHRFSAHLEVSASVEEQGMRVRDAVTWEASGVFDAVSAGRSQDLNLRARFAPAACEPSLSSGGLVDFGTLSKNDLNNDKSTRLAARSLTLRVTCDAPTIFALTMQDNRLGSATVNSEIYYGLGTDSRVNRIGLYSLSIDPTDASADSFSRLYRTDSTTNGNAWSTAQSKPISIGQKSYLGFTDSAGSTAGPVAIQNLTSTVTVDAVIAPLNSLDLSTAVELDGSGTLEIIYL